MKQQIDALQKFQNQLLSTFNAQDLTYFKRSGWDGMLTSIDRLYATMLHDWDVLRKDSDSIEKAVRSLEWSITPFVQKGEKPTPEASKIAKVVEDALWRRTPQTLGTYAHSFVQLLGSIVHAEFRGQNVHRIDWKNDGKLVYPAAYVQLPPQFLRWEIEPGKPDLLLHVPDGEVAKPVPFKPYQFIVALNNTGPDHPLYNATYYSLVAWFCAAKNGLGWFMQYAEQHHLPKPVFHYDNDEDREQIIKDLSQERVINAFLLYGDKQVEWASTPTGTTMPQKELLELSEARCHKAILGQTLTSDTSKGGGSLAQARVHAGVQADEVMKHAEFVADVINRQLIPAIVHLNFGKVEGLPLPELRYKLPQAAANIERAQFWSQVLQIPGISVVKSEVYDSLGIAIPSDDDEVLSTPEPQESGLSGMLQGLGGGKEEMQPMEERAVASRARNVDGLTRALPAWLAPIKKKLIAARNEGASFDELRKQMAEWRLNTDALAAAFAENVEAGLRGERKDEELAAKKKHPGCNQKEHKPGCPKGENDTKDFSLVEQNLSKKGENKLAYKKYAASIDKKKSKSKTKRSNKIGKVDKKAIFYVGHFPELELLGVKNGEVKVDGVIVREGMTRGRWTANNATRRINESLKNCKLLRKGVNHKKPNVAVVEAFCILQTETKTYYNKIVIECDTGKVITLHDIGKSKFEKETKKEPAKDGKR